MRWEDMDVTHARANKEGGAICRCTGAKVLQETSGIMLRPAAPAGRPFHATTGSVEHSVTHGIIRGRLTCALGLLVGPAGFSFGCVG